MCADGCPFPSKSPIVFEEETLGLDFRSLGVALMDLGFGVGFNNPLFSRVVSVKLLAWV
jgi:hypothetical protein